jgi:hypothetical protein
LGKYTYVVASINVQNSTSLSDLAACPNKVSEAHRIDDVSEGLLRRQKHQSWLPETRIATPFAQHVAKFEATLPAVFGCQV